jgi:hypothetical protein
MRELDPRIHDERRHVGDLRKAAVIEPLHGWPGQAQP